MAEIDRRAVLRGGVLFGAALITAGGVAVTTAEFAEAVPLPADKTGPIKTDDPFKDHDLVERAQYWRRRRRRWVCWWRRRRRVCVRRW